MQHSTDRILTSHSGSLPRPAELVKLLEQRAEGGAVDVDALSAAIRQSVHDVVHKQAATGITVVNDGEHSKISYAGYLKDRLSGFEELEQGELVHRLELRGESDEFPRFFQNKMRHVARRAFCTGPLGWRNFGLVEADIANLKAAGEGLGLAGLFMSAASPTTAVSFQPNRYYPSTEDYAAALADVLRREYQAITDAGIILQVDFPVGVSSRTFPVGTPIADIRRDLDAKVEMLNYALKGLPAEQVRIHMCWGSDEGPHTRDVALRDIADILMRIDAAGITLVGANGRHAHDYQVWRDIKLPDGKVIIAGVIDSTSNIIEHPETVRDRIVSYADVIGRENVVAGVDCGFSTIAGTEEFRVDAEIAWAKLRSLAIGAEMASDQLWKSRPRAASA